jgi:Ulp1 protease family, C-terminal catalytic domain
LVDEGPVGVSKWTAKRNINVFEKKFVFIPINEALHWSLCVVVNPGSIVDDDEDAPMACMILLDSLKAHKKKKVSQQVRRWLNSEWRRINCVKEEPFADENHFPLLDPKSESYHFCFYSAVYAGINADLLPCAIPTVPYQNNSCDCGVFVCRYAYSVYALRGRDFRRNKQWFAEDLTRIEPFRFNMEDIARLRRDIKTLIQGLSGIFLPWKNEQQNSLKKQAIRHANESRRRAVVANEANDRPPSALPDSVTEAISKERRDMTTPAATNGSSPKRKNAVSSPSRYTGGQELTAALNADLQQAPGQSAQEGEPTDEQYYGGRPSDEEATAGHTGDFMDDVAGELPGAVCGFESSDDNYIPPAPFQLARVTEKETFYRSPSRLHSNDGGSRRAVSTPQSAGSLTYLTGESQTDRI